MKGEGVQWRCLCGGGDGRGRGLADGGCWGNGGDVGVRLGLGFGFLFLVLGWGGYRCRLWRFFGRLLMFGLLFSSAGDGCCSSTGLSSSILSARLITAYPDAYVVMVLLSHFWVTGLYILYSEKTAI